MLVADSIGQHLLPGAAVAHVNGTIAVSLPPISSALIFMHSAEMRLRTLSLLLHARQGRAAEMSETHTMLFVVFRVLLCCCVITLP